MQPFARLAAKPAMPTRVMLQACVALFAMGSASQASAAFTQVISFGDSLSDSGNISLLNPGFPLAPYYPGHFSNGPVWIETFSAGLGLSSNPSFGGGTNYALGGSVTGTPLSSPIPLTSQAGLYLTNVSGVADPTALYVIWGGGNDVRLGNVSNSVTNIGSIVAALSAAGAEHFLIANLPNIGLTPEAQAGGPAQVAGATFLSNLHNTNLAAAIPTWETTYGINIRELDVWTFLNNVIANPGLYGITNTTGRCYSGTTGVGGPGTVCSNPDEYVFWDGIHPTAAAHEALGQYALQVVPVPAAVYLLGSALALLGWVRRKAA